MGVDRTRVTLTGRSASGRRLGDGGGGGGGVPTADDCRAPVHGTSLGRDGKNSREQVHAMAVGWASRPGARSRFDLWMRVTAPAREGRKEGAKNIKTYWHISRFTYGKLL